MKMEHFASTSAPYTRNILGMDNLTGFRCRWYPVQLPIPLPLRKPPCRESSILQHEYEGMQVYLENVPPEF